MAKTYPIQIEITKGAYSRLRRVAEDVAPLLDRPEPSPAAVIDLLLEHWVNRSPQISWIKDYGNLMTGFGQAKWEDRQ